MRSGTHNATRALLSATLRTMHYAAVQRASTALHVCEVGRDVTGQDHPDEIEVRSDGMGSSQVRSSQTKSGRDEVHTMYTQTPHSLLHKNTLV